MIPIILAALASAAPAPRVSATAPAASDPPVRISLNSGGDYYRGDRAKVRIRTAADGYLIVLRADVSGRVRVLFPLDPGDDDFVRGGKDYELRGRGDRETFPVDDVAGTGTVLAAYSPGPFHYEQFIRGDHWDYRVLDDAQVRDDAEAGLLDLVTEMADSEHFDYDVVTYSVDGGGHRYYSSSYGGWYGPRFGFGYCDRFLYDPFYCESIFYDPFFYGYDPFYYGFGFSYGFGRPYGYSCFTDPFCYGYGYGHGHGYFIPGRRRGGGFVFKRPATPPPLILPRRRDAAGVVNVGWRDAGGGVTRIEPRRREPAASPVPRDRRPQVGERRGSSARPAPRSRNDRPSARPAPRPRNDRPSARPAPRPRSTGSSHPSSTRRSARPASRPRSSGSSHPSHGGRRGH